MGMDFFSDMKKKCIYFACVFQIAFITITRFLPAPDMGNVTEVGPI
jgi:hypothetical protein